METKSQARNGVRRMSDAETIKAILNQSVYTVTHKLDISRDAFADMLTTRANDGVSRDRRKTVTPGMLRNWVSPSQPHEIPLWALIAWYKVVRDRSMLDKILGLMGLTSKTSEDAELIGLAKEIVRRELKDREIGIRLQAICSREDAA